MPEGAGAVGSSLGTAGSVVGSSLGAGASGSVAVGSCAGSSEGAGASEGAGCSVAGASVGSWVGSAGSSGAVVGSVSSPEGVAPAVAVALSPVPGSVEGCPWPFPLPLPPLPCPLPAFSSPGSIMSSRSASGTAVSLPPATTRASTASDGPTHSGSEAPRTREASPSSVSGARMPKSRSRQSVHVPLSAPRVRICAVPSKSSALSSQETPTRENICVSVRGSSRFFGSLPSSDSVCACAGRDASSAPLPPEPPVTDTAVTPVPARTTTPAASHIVRFGTLGRRARIPLGLMPTPHEVCTS